MNREIEIDCRIVTETDAAILIVVPGNDEEIWVPLSQVSCIVRGNDAAQRDRITMTRWIADKKGLL
jgi:hypothetical protein